MLFYNNISDINLTLFTIRYLINNITSANIIEETLD